jgi:hypothetical protein
METVDHVGVTPRVALRGDISAPVPEDDLNEIRPFHETVPEAELTELRRRINATKWLERAYPKLIYYHTQDKGGCFPGWEQPQLFSEEVRAAFTSLRS